MKVLHVKEHPSSPDAVEVVLHDDGRAHMGGRCVYVPGRPPLEPLSEAVCKAIGYEPPPPKPIEEAISIVAPVEEAVSVRRRRRKS